MSSSFPLSHGFAAARPAVRRIGVRDLKAALSRGVDDFLAMPTHVLFVVLIYPVAGVLIAAATFEQDLIPILFPLAAGFALIGPFAALGLYELSRRREWGLPALWTDAFAPLHGRSARAVMAVGVVLALIFLAWLCAAMGLYWSLYGGVTEPSVSAFLGDVLTTPRGWTLILAGNLVGAAFSLLALAVSAVSIPLIIDRDVEAGTAIETSLALMRENPGPMLAWGAIVAGLLVLGMVSLFVGLAVVLPVLGHATWHLYRRAVG
ncbi:cytochrome C oxidase subunit I [Methylobacterium indicum]|uniref:DUF2189 domain-containing protein n=1 Tax=Methylobacterium indicum TaxID=1775910 RepID=UPI000734F3D1|nr:DUF2189 domain-containing protein [Methylobacterium indicum]KTS26667.1 cytochrome C oxidase subunit I [Methylobacterium indicum]KTS40426.1 cytochrome C oxidase subunit I [Methylobacterium indicum]KTS53343.1 cytochrome C oxidase subunit I [Methylobacterium indicum]